MKELIVITSVTLLAVAIAIPALAAENVVLCTVDIGDTASEAGHDMDGWGPPEPSTHGGNWGGIGSEPGDCRVIWFSHNAPATEDEYAYITLDRCERNGAATAIRVRHLDGIADDSFNIFVKNNHGDWISMGSYTWSGNSSEFWVETTFIIPDVSAIAHGRPIEVKLEATGTQWSGFGTYGQVAFDWIELIGNSKGN